MTGDNKPTPSLGFLQRISVAIKLFFNALSDGEFAARSAMFDQPAKPPAPAAMPPQPAPVLQLAPETAALQLLTLLQREARFIDFTQENLGQFSDAEIGAAARVVHEGCAKVMREYFSLQPIMQDGEGSRVTLAAGFDNAAIRLTGNVSGSAPYSGNLSHAGWRASEVRLPQLAPGHDSRILAQAEVEL